MAQKILKAVWALATISALAYFTYPILAPKWQLVAQRYFPCKTPIAYSLGDFDTRFGISKKDFLDTVALAEAIWEKPAGKDLFAYEEDDGGLRSDMKVNLVYDYRQEATEKIKDIKDASSGTRASYNELKAKYAALQKSLAEDKAEYESRVKSFKSRQDAYNKNVKYWNSQGGAPASEYEKLNQEQKELEQEFTRLHEMQDDINKKVSDINALVEVINPLARELNINAAELGTIGRERGEEFTEGEYRVDASGQEINIYEFSSKEQLRRLLAHELGHALGLDHVVDPKGVMYRLNQGKGDTLTKDDLAALNAHCQIK